VHPVNQPFWLLNSGVQRHAGSRQLAKFADKNYFQKSSLKRDGPVFFLNEAVKLRIKMEKQSSSFWWAWHALVFTLNHQRIKNTKTTKRTQFKKCKSPIEH
jgi:hypothetical protein